MHVVMNECELSGVGDLSSADDLDCGFRVERDERAEHLPLRFPMFNCIVVVLRLFSSLAVALRL